jgi:hypothetical protein
MRRGTFLRDLCDPIPISYREELDSAWGEDGVEDEAMALEGVGGSSRIGLLSEFGCGNARGTEGLEMERVRLYAGGGEDNVSRRYSPRSSPDFFMLSEDFRRFTLEVGGDGKARGIVSGEDSDGI